MRIVLALPAWDPLEVYSDKFARSQISFQHPSGPLYIAANLERAGHTVIMIDGSFYTHAQVLKQIVDFKPDVVGFYSDTPLWIRVKRTIRDLRTMLPKIKICAGGPFPIGLPRTCMTEVPDLDMVCTCEGEYVMVECCERWAKGESLEGINGTWYRDEPQGEIKRNPDRDPIENLDDLPHPARHLIVHEFKKYVTPPGTYRQQPIANIIGSRGCTNRCIFCFHIDRRDRYIRFRSPENVADELRQCITNWKFREFRFLDDNFTGNYDRVMNICEEFYKLRKDLKWNFTWFCSCRVGDVDLPLLKAMRRAGCWQILFGVEAGIQKDLDALHKNITPDEIRRAFKLSKEAGIKTYAPFILGIPGQTWDDAIKSIDFSIEIDPNYVNYNTLTPFPFTPLWDELESFGHMIARDYSQFTFQHAAFVPHTMTQDELVRLRELAFKRFYDRPGYIIRKFWDALIHRDFRLIRTGVASWFNLHFAKRAFEPNAIGEKVQDKVPDDVNILHLAGRKE